MTLQEDLNLSGWTKVTQQELDEILEKHELFVDNSRGGERAKLSMHNLSR